MTIMTQCFLHKSPPLLGESVIQSPSLKNTLAVVHKLISTGENLFMREYMKTIFNVCEYE